MLHQNMGSGKTSEDGQAESEHGSMEASEELEFRSRSTEVMVSRSEALQRSED